MRLETDARRVAWITLARPERKNAFDAALIAELIAKVAAVDPASRAVVLMSEGDAFCAGADLEWMKSMVDYGLERNAADSRALAEMYAALDALPMPLLARVQGAAIGGGAGLVAVADIAVASTEATFGFTEVRLGIIPAVVSPYVVRKVGPGHATALFLSGVRFDARRAMEIGLVEAVESPEELDAKLALYLDAVVAGGPARGERREAARARRRGTSRHGGPRAHGEADRRAAGERRRPGGHAGVPRATQGALGHVTTLLVANRGEIARRIFRTAKRMGMRTVAVYSDADASLPFVREADIAVRLGPAPASESYLDIERIVAAATETGTDLVHPGYGFLAESPQLASAVAARGLRFVGPPPEVLASLGDKAKAKDLARLAGVPTLPGFYGRISATSRFSRLRSASATR